jgi:hypothetical protein
MAGNILVPRVNILVPRGNILVPRGNILVLRDNIPGLSGYTLVQVAYLRLLR